MQLNMPIDSEILSPAEVAQITGHARKDKQIAWLRACGWKFFLNAAGAPIIGRWYARLKLAGVELSETISPQVSMPDFSKAR
jgi:hypothetical protein